MTKADRFNPFDEVDLSQEKILAGIELLESSMRKSRKPSEPRPATADARRRSPHLLTLKKCA